MKTCIYCKEKKNPSEFNTEHVIPKAFGSFEPDSPTLGCVCSVCNTYFGGHLDQPLARDSFEGWERQFFGMWPKKDRKQTRVKSVIREKGFNQDLIVKPRPGKDGIPENYTPTQVGIFNLESGKYRYFEINDLPPKEQLLSEFEMKEHPIDFRPYGDEPTEALLKPFSERGLEIKLIDTPETNDVSEIINQKGLIEITVVLDTTIKRALSKIAFNYLAATAGEDLVAREDFDEIRGFIRYERHKNKADTFFKPNQPPIFDEERRLERAGFKARIATGHILTVRWRNWDAIARITLLNRNIYEIVLCKNFSGLWREVRSGHFFDIKTKRVSRLYGNPFTGMLVMMQSLLQRAVKRR